MSAVFEIRLDLKAKSKKPGAHLIKVIKLQIQSALRYREIKIRKQLIRNWRLAMIFSLYKTFLLVRALTGLLN